MSSNPSQPNRPRPSGFQTIRSWLRGMVESLRPSETNPPKEGEILPAWDTSAATLPPTSSPPLPAIPEAEPIPAAVPVAEIVLPAPTSLLPVTEVVPSPAPVSSASGECGGPSLTGYEITHMVPKEVPSSPVLFQEEVGISTALPLTEPVPPPAPPPPPCPSCGSPRSKVEDYCDTCGFLFPEEPTARPTPGPPVTTPGPLRLHGRYELLQRWSERRGVERFHGLDHGSPLEGPVAVVIVRAPVPASSGSLPIAEVVPTANTTSTNQDIPLAMPVTAEVVPQLGILQEKELLAKVLSQGSEAGGLFPLPAPGLFAPPREANLCWERTLLQTVGHPFLPAVLDNFFEGGFEYLIEEIPSGRILWDAWDDPEATAEQRFNWLRHLVEQMQALHRAGAMLESLRPDMIVVTTKDQGRLADLSELLPLPLHAGLPIRGSLYTAPELVTDPGQADIRASLYSFGALLYALHIGRELTEMDFDHPGYPRPFVPQFPDIHPAFGRLMMKTFCREPAHRFPSDEGAREDPSGLTELGRTLETCSRTLDNVHLEVAAWTTTGMVRSGNEDAYALLQAGESRQDDSAETALVLLADGMGGYEAGEVAAALTIESLRKELLQHEPFSVLAGHSQPATVIPQGKGEPPPALDVEQVKKLIGAALRGANQQVFTAARNGVGGRGMGCTAEVVYLGGRHVVVGHVGDSRVYHLQEGRLRQLTRDHTLVNRLVEIGSLTPEEAERHPRRNELQQAIGGQPDVEPSLYHARLKAGDWVVVCSDGLSNHVKDRDLRQMLESEATSADMAARRLVNLANIQGATDNATVVVVRAT